jgi:peptide/nickel transport system permease protein
MKKNRGIFKKLIYALITVAVVIVFNYWLFRVMPGDALASLMRDPKATDEMIAAVRALYGLDQPWHTQFFIYLRDLFHGDLGMSFIYKAPVSEVIGGRILPTVLLLGLAEALAIVAGIVFGLIAAWKRGTKLDLGLLGFSLVTYAMPTFWLGMIMVAVFSVNLRLFPTSGMMTPGTGWYTASDRFADIANHLVLPTVTMAILLIGEYALTMRNTLIDVLSEDYITTARAKGFSERYILMKHALPNGMLPMVTIIAINLGLVIAGAIQIETVFSWPGLGNLMYESLKARDYPLLQGVFLLVTISVVAANFIADMVYRLIDPRVKG